MHVLIGTDPNGSQRCFLAAQLSNAMMIMKYAQGPNKFVQIKVRFSFYILKFNALIAKLVAKFNFKESITDNIVKRRGNIHFIFLL